MKTLLLSFKKWYLDSWLRFCLFLQHSLNILHRVSEHSRLSPQKPFFFFFGGRKLRAYLESIAYLPMNLGDLEACNIKVFVSHICSGRFFAVFFCEMAHMGSCGVYRKREYVMT